DVYGGYSNEGDAINNTINLFHNSGRDINTLGKHFLVKGIIYGGLSGDKSKDSISGNTLNVTGKDLIAGNIKNFNEVNFNLPKDIKTNDIALQLTNNVDTALRNVTVNTYVEKGKSKAIVKNLKPGEKIYVIKKASIDESTLKETDSLNKELTIENKKLSNKTISEVGASTVYDVELNQDKSNLFLEVSKNATPKTNPKLNHTLIPNLASSHVVNQMSDLVSDNIPNIAILDNNISANTDNIISFGYVKGYKSNIGKNDTDVNGAIVDVGVASRADNTLMGGFFEYSYADYDGSINSYKNDGKIKAYAVGALARFDLRNNFFIDSYAKIGKLNNKYTLKGYDNLNINKDSTFYSLGAFLGHDSYFDRFMLTNRLGYAYSNVDGYELDIDGETLNVKDISSKRIKFDSIAYYKTNTDTNLYARAR
ncbi:autotransporter outer membrane beta-barrel domain-containing protein, partial [Campylobacter ureolyticus]|uniref:autotransporter outer membrane beta-barrel domain-containing protein n=1 Tax=Campylobacter ureolyticus TaxID=827 RepID=UPI0022B4B62E